MKASRKKMSALALTVALNAPPGAEATPSASATEIVSISKTWLDLDALDSGTTRFAADGSDQCRPNCACNAKCNANCGRLGG